MTGVKSKSFFIATVLGVLGIVSLSFMSVGFGLLKNAFTTHLVVVAPDSATAASIQKALADSYAIDIAPEHSKGAQLPAQVRDDIRKRIYDAGLVAYRTKDGLAFTFYPRQVSSLERGGGLRDVLLPIVVADAATGPIKSFISKALNFKFNTVALNERYKNQNEEFQATALVYFLLLLMYIAVILYGVYVAQGVIEEKSNRIMEVMIGAVRPSQLLAGKVLGIGAVALTQMLIFALAGGAMIVVAGMFVAQSAPPTQVAAAMHQASMNGGISLVPPATLVFLLTFFLL